MKRAIVREYEQLEDYLSQENAVFAFRLRNLCVKAEPVSLLPIEVLIEGELQKLEQCTTIGKDDDYSFMIFPHYDEDIVPLGQSIMVAHPEFKQEVKSMKVDGVDENGNDKETDVRYILVTMPEVDDDRYDVLKDGVKLAYDDCKGRMEAINLKADAKFAMITPGESDEDIQKLKNARDKLNEQWNGQRDRIYNEKLQEIEDAHNKWLADLDEKEKKRKEDEASHSQSAATSMRINSDDVAN